MEYFNLFMASLILFVVSIGLFTTINTSRRNFCLYSTMVLVYMVMSLMYYISDYFTGEGINQSTIYHIRYGLDGAGVAEYKNLFIMTSAVISMSLLLFTFIYLRTKSKNNKKTSYRSCFIAYIFFVLAILVHPAAINAYKLCDNFYELESSGPDFCDYYHSTLGKETSQQERNFVFIYLEGFERTYFNERLFPGLVDGLKKLETSGISFVNVGQTANAGWTIAGMVASQCGLPLIAPSAGNSMSGMDVFLPEAVCLGDLLAAEGYRLAYYGGANLEFAGKGKFLENHGFDEVKGFAELRTQLDNADYVTGWGLYDDSLLNMAFDRYLEMSRCGERFGLFLLTLDTHHPDGHPSASCSGLVYLDGTNKMLNAVACTDGLVSRFVDRIRKSKYGDNTVIVIASDHLALRNNATAQLQKGERKNLFLILDPAVETPSKVDKQGTTLDIGATILPFLGYCGEIGLGRDLRAATPSLEEVLGGLDAILRRWQPAIKELWSFPKIRREMMVNVATGTVNIDGRSFGYPTLIRLNSQLETEMRFALNMSAGQKTLHDELNSFNSTTPFIWIDNCKQMNSVSSTRSENGVCLAIGRLDVNPNRRRLKGKVIEVGTSLNISAEEIRETLFN